MWFCSEFQWNYNILYFPQIWSGQSVLIRWVLSLKMRTNCAQQYLQKSPIQFNFMRRIIETVANNLWQWNCIRCKWIWSVVSLLPNNYTAYALTPFPYPKRNYYLEIIRFKMSSFSVLRFAVTTVTWKQNYFTLRVVRIPFCHNLAHKLDSRAGAYDRINKARMSGTGGHKDQ